MTYAELSPAAQKSIQEMVRVFEVPRMLRLNKMEMGEVIAMRANQMGQDGQQFVHHVYNVSVHEAGLHADEHKLYLLRSFLSTICKSVLKNHGYPTQEWQHVDLAQDVILKVADGEL